MLVLCRGETLSLQSQLADAQEEAQLLRRLVTLCNQALNSAAADSQPALAVVEEEQEQQQRSSQQLRAADTAKVTLPAGITCQLRCPF